ncbi:TrwN protein [Bartonella sp. AU18XJBT]|uniref:TrwN protein n=1 Tax=Bartonella sp. AU18XJBT TaxID=3019089 RepID=UPI002360F68C|nr:TrwN protein [Bartonella sp. AU18XJBT]
MIVPDFTFFAAAYMFNTPPIAFSVIAEQEVQDSVYVTGGKDNFFYQSSQLEKTIATAEQFKQNKHNFDIISGQINAGNVKLFSLFDAFDFCRNIKAEQSALTYCYEQITPRCIFEKATLQSVLNFYDTKHSNNISIQKITSYIGAKAAVRGNEDLQEPVKLKKEEPEQTTKLDSLPLSSKGEEDAFTHKESGASDAFSAEDSSSSRSSLE